MRRASFLFFLASFFVATHTLKIIENGLAPPEIVHTPMAQKARCEVRASPLDLVFVLDSSGSLRNSFQDEIDVIRRIVKHVTIGADATRVMLVQFSGVQHLEFNFLKFSQRDEVLAALDVLRHVSGITRIGEAFQFTLEHLNAENGVRGASVPKIVYLLSDGRTHDYPKDWEMTDLLRRRVPNSDIWAYGTGDYVAWPALINYTKSEDKIITNKNVDKLESLFNEWKGSEVCEKVPGTDRPLDLALIFDASESVDRLFHLQVAFAVNRVLRHISVHPEAVRLALISYSGKTFVHFKFNSLKYSNNSAVEKHLESLRSIKGVTSTNVALHAAFNLFTDPLSGVREGVPKLALVLTDGHSQHSPGPMAARLRALNVTLLAVSVTPPEMTDERELLQIAGDPQRVFVQKNLMDFEKEFLKYVGFGCPGLELGPDARATDVSCDATSVTFTVRTQRPMSGLMYAQQFHDDPQCLLGRDGYVYNLTVILQFHPLIITRADQGLDVSCFHAQRLSEQEVGRSSLKKLTDTTCSYRLHRFGPEECVALDAKVGESLFHKWQCDAPSNYHYLVHDCFVISDSKRVQILDSHGCEIDAHFLETPDYSRLTTRPRKGEPYVFQEMAVFKFPTDSNLIFECQVSLCDMESNDACVSAFPPRCSPGKEMSPASEFSFAVHRHRRAAPVSEVPRVGFSMTFHVETRTLNVLENESIRPSKTVKYCDVRY